MTGVLRLRRGDADCHGSDIGDWFGMTGGTGLARNGGSGAV